jgi:hypothetical protein
VERLDLGEHHRVGGTARKRHLVEAVDVGAGQQARGIQPHGGGNLAGGQPVVAGDQPDRDGLAGQPTDGLGGAGLGRVQKGQQAPQRHLGLVGRTVQPGPVQGPGGQGEHAVAVTAELGEPLLQPRHGLAQRHSLAVDLGTGAHLQHLVERALW